MPQVRRAHAGGPLCERAGRVRPLLVWKLQLATQRSCWLAGHAVALGGRARDRNHRHAAQPVMTDMGTGKLVSGRNGVGAWEAAASRPLTVWGKCLGQAMRSTTIAR